MQQSFEGFLERYREWIERDSPPEDWQASALDWICEIQDDPTYAAVPDSNFGRPFWTAAIPYAENDTHGVICTYVITDDLVKCSTFATLRKPMIF